MNILLVAQQNTSNLPTNISNVGLGGLLLSLVGIAGVFIWRIIVNGRKTDETTNRIIETQVTALIDPLREEVDRLRISDQNCRMRLAVYGKVLIEHGIPLPPEVIPHD